MRKVAVGTTQQSIDARQPTWFVKKVFQFCDGSLLRLGKYLATVESATTCPNNRNSDAIRGAPHVTLSRAIAGSGAGCRPRWQADLADSATSNASGVQTPVGASGRRSPGRRSAMRAASRATSVPVPSRTVGQADAVGAGGPKRRRTASAGGGPGFQHQSRTLADKTPGEDPKQRHAPHPGAGD